MQITMINNFFLIEMLILVQGQDISLNDRRGFVREMQSNFLCSGGSSVNYWNIKRGMVGGRDNVQTVR
jgi:hypothetical protein